MSAQIIAERIDAAIRGGVIRPRPAREARPYALLMSDLLRPYGEVFPHAQETGFVNPSSVHQLRKPTFRPQPRRSRQPIGRMRHSTGSIKMVEPSLFKSAAAVWEWYGRNGKDDPELIARPFGHEGIEAFINPLYMHVPDPLGRWLEDPFMDGAPWEMNGFTLELPSFHYDEEIAGVVEAFLTGESGPACLLESNYEDEGFLSVRSNDKALIDKVGFPELIKVYYHYEGEKTYPLAKLENHWENYFGEVFEKYPFAGDEWDVAIIVADYWPQVLIQKPEDIDAAIAFEKAWGDLYNDLPDLWAFYENDVGIVDRFVEELCTIYRKVNQKEASRDHAA